MVVRKLCVLLGLAILQIGFARAATIRIIPRAAEVVGPLFPAHPGPLDPVEDEPRGDGPPPAERSASPALLDRDPFDSSIMIELMPRAGVESTGATAAETPAMDVTATDVPFSGSPGTDLFDTETATSGTVDGGARRLVVEDAPGEIAALDLGLETRDDVSAGPASRSKPASQASASAVADGSFFAVPTERSPPSSTSRPFHANIKVDVYDKNTNNPDRTLRDRTAGAFTDAHPTLEYARTDNRGTSWNMSLGAKVTDNPVVQAAEFGGACFEITGSPVFEITRGTEFTMRVGEITPQFSPFTLSTSGLGAQLARQIRGRDTVTEIQLFVARMVRQDAPGTLRRDGSGVRLANAWDFHEQGSLSVAGQAVAMQDDETSVTEPFAGTSIPQNDVYSLNAIYTHPRGYVAGLEMARSDGERNDFTALARVRERGAARREFISYTDPKTTRSFQFAHQRIEPTFLAPASAAGVDIDHHSFSLGFPVNPKLRVGVSYNRVYNDILRQNAGRGQNESYQADLDASPFLGQKRRWLAGLGLRAGVLASDSEATDGSFSTFNRQWTFAVTEAIGRLRASYQLQPRRELDDLNVLNNFHRNQSTYILAYEVHSEVPGQWSVSPTIQLVHDRDRNDPAVVVDRKDRLSVGFEGRRRCQHGESTFGYTFTEGDDRIRSTSTSTANRSHAARFELPMDDEGARLALTYDSRMDRTSGNAALRESTLLGSMNARW